MAIHDVEIIHRSEDSLIIAVEMDEKDILGMAGVRFQSKNARIAARILKQEEQYLREKAVFKAALEEEFRFKEQQAQLALMNESRPEMTNTDTQATTKPLPPLEPRQTGTVKWFDPKKGFGFILRDGDKDVFFHSADAKKSGLDDDLEEGERVSFALAPTPRGFKAVSLKREH